METALVKRYWRPQNIDWEAILPECSLPNCRRNRGRWHGLLHRSEGVRCGEDWYCSPQCLQDSLASQLSSLVRESSVPCPIPAHRIPLGLILLSRGQVAHDLLQAALTLQKAEGGRVGDCLRRISSVTEEQIASALARQWSCPVYPSSRGSECRHMIPKQLQEYHRMLPVHFVESTRELYLAFEQVIDYTLLFAIEQMLGCHTRPCVLCESELRSRLAIEFPRTTTEIAFETTVTPHELARTVCGYLQQSGAEQVRILGCGTHVWIRLTGNARTLDLLVRRWQR